MPSALRQSGFDALEVVPLGSVVRGRIEAMILDGRLGPGAKLNEVALATELGVSRGPIREATRALERAGLVTVIMNRGAFVRAVPLEEALDSYALSGLLFAYSAGQLAIRHTARQVSALRDLVDAMDMSAAADDRDAFFAGNIGFHESVVAFAGNRQIEATYLEHTRKLGLPRRRAFDADGNLARSNAEHRRVLDAVVGGDADAARRHGEEHARAGRERFLAALGRVAEP